jgi:hypothetical protein
MGKRSHKAVQKCVTRDSDIRSALLEELRIQYGDPDNDLIIEEFGCKKARADVAVINGSLHAFEIKSDSDSLERLPSQMQAYQDVFEYITLVCGRRLLDRAHAVIPKYWGLQKAIFIDGKVVLREIRTAKFNQNQNALALAHMLWKTEALSCLRKYGHRQVTSRNTAEEVSEAVAAYISSIPTLTSEVRAAIKARGGSGFERRSTQDDDWYTTQSTFQQYHLSLDWLLSAQ